VCVRALIDAGSDLKANSIDGYTPLHWAAWYGNCACVRTLIAAGLDPNNADGIRHETPLHLAAWYGNDMCIKTLIASGANPKIIDIRGKTPLHLSAKIGRNACVRELIAAAADPEVIDNTGKTPLQLAVENEFQDCAGLLAVRIVEDRPLTDDEWDLIPAIIDLGYLLPTVLARDGRDVAGKLVSRLPEEKRKVLENAMMCLSHVVLRDLIGRIAAQCM